MKLHFDYDASDNQSYAYIGGDDETALYRVAMVQDSCPSNPFKEWDGHWPMIVRHGRDNEDTYGDMPCPIAMLSNGQIVRHQAAIMNALGDKDKELDDFTTYTLADDLRYWLQHKRPYYDAKAEALRDYFSDALGNVSGSDKLETMATLYRLAGIECLCTSSSGYSQGDYAELLIVATHEAMDAFGWNKRQRRDKARIAKDMQGQADLYGAWAWGDVYGYVCAFRPCPESDWQEFDSCWGFYGDDADKSGLAEQAAWAIEADIRDKRKARWQKLAELIRARVPLSIRAAILGQPDFTLASA